MDSVPSNDMNVMDDPEGGCIVQADDPQMLAAAAFDGAGCGAGNNTWYWTSMLKLMEQGSAAPPSSTSTLQYNSNNINYTAPAPPFTPGQQQATADRTPRPAQSASASSPSSSSVHDQPMDMVTQNNALNACDPDSSVWAQEFLSGPIGENKSSSIACSDDGLHELLYPRTVLELLFSDQLKLEQMPSWPDILQAHTAVGLGPAKSFGFPLTSEIKGEAGTTLQDNVSMDHHMKCSQYYSHLAGIEDRLSSSTTNSTLSDNAMDQWAVPAQAGSTSGGQCAENMQAHPGAIVPAHSSSLSNMQHMKQEYNHVAASPPLISSNDHGCHYPISQYNNLHHHPENLRIMGNNGNMIAAGSNGFQESMMNDEYEQKPTSLLSKLWSPAVLNSNDPLAHMNHKHHIYESITAANFSHNLRQLAGLSTGNGYNLQSVNSINMNIAPSSLQNYIHQPSQVQLSKKSRPFQDGGAGASAARHQYNDHGAQLVESAHVIRKDESKNIMLQQLAAAVDQGSNPSIVNMSAASLVADDQGANNNIMRAAMHGNNLQQQLSGAAGYSNFKRSRIEEQPAAAAATPPPTSSTSGSSSTTNQNQSTSSCSAFKSPPVRKEKLSERIATLQQLVSPFGKTDTASVLLEAIGYIKFLQEQVQALSSPYFKSPTIQSGDRDQNAEEDKPDLRRSFR
ncbi:hypothetical protein GOP47_0007146 [Adiantum capillus-veneris]|uniref:BHLH domain-containing protein n=1 Tax=Adiantum capillus-veneris TaxID=13818 RepID=A0A9D4V1K1_ADICA|nr:hypothetical protein GOP47_0007146 [Adiantum capillus-veneris]